MFERWRRVAGLVAAFGATVVLSACGAPQARPDAPADIASAPTATPSLPSILQATGPKAPEFVGTGAWINSDPLTIEGLRGRVVLVDFWTYSCYNCQNTQPALKAWHEQYGGHGLVIVGVHSPEFQFEHLEANVRKAVVEAGIEWPVVQDNDFATWQAYANRYWPTVYLVDKDGVVRARHIGEGAYAEIERAIRELLAEAGYDVGGLPLVTAAPA